MRPKKKRVGHEQPDASKETEVNETLGGTDGEGMGEDEDWGRTVPDGDPGYARPEPEEDEQPF